MSGLTFIAQRSIGELVPIVVGATAAASAQIQADFQGSASLEASLSITPPTVDSEIALLAEISAQLLAGEPLPQVSFGISACASLNASLSAAAALCAQLTGLFPAAGIFVYEYDGPAVALGPALTAELALTWPDGTPTAGHCNALILGATDPATWTAMKSFFGGG